jgi:hypothetical protein
MSENDPAGMGIAFTKAINRYTDSHCRLITTKTRYNFNFEKDIHLPDVGVQGIEEIREILRDADIFHFHILADENMKLGPVNVKDHIKGKVIVHHHHGHPEFRAHPEKYRDKYRMLKRRALVSTPDLLRLLPEATWQPNLVPVDDPLYMPATTANNGVFQIGQSVTRKDLKDTETLLHVVGEVARRFPRDSVKLDIIENTDHRECLRRKNRCHVIFDHMQGYFGVSSLESLSQGKPVIAGIDSWNKRHILDFAGGADLPWVVARDRETLLSSLFALKNENARIPLGTYARTWMEAVWSEKRVVGQLIEFYDTLL